MSVSLPPHLQERRRVVRDAEPAPQGELILYWMHHAVRAHENPALDTARRIASQMGLPLLVYQGLGGRHTYDSDRHHTFILEGAREVAAELQALTVRHVFHLGPRADDPSPLDQLVSRAALVITEEFPVPPFARWLAALARRPSPPVWAIDTACLVPMRFSDNAPTRAFRFRRQFEREYQARLPRPWPETDVEVQPFFGELGFSPTDLESADIAELCARCEIDHSVGPVHHTPGGASAGYRRWKEFRDEGLARYHQERNDAAIEPPRGVSRLSPYLHHGQISPFRIAREANDAGGKGADKFLDELLFWRELAHHFCFHTESLEELGVLPDWARETLARHRKDERRQVYSRERLSRGATGRELWDLAQRSLLAHGELHNNLRMTWGKALVEWTPDPETALATLIDLNHRYALDGSDPNSYGGLLWCLGQFDRPFEPERPVIGRVRPRSLHSHAKRLDLDRYRDRVLRPAIGGAMRVAVVGAGPAGLMAGRILADQGHRVRLFDKSRGVGGRTSTRRVEDVAFDHGAQYFTLRDRRLRPYLDSWIEEGVVARWRGRIVARQDRRWVPKTDTPRYVGKPGMSAVAGHLAADLDVQTRSRVIDLSRGDAGWSLTLEDDSTQSGYDLVLVTAPAPQTAQLLHDAAPVLAAAAQAIEMVPCWALLLSFDTALELDFDGLFANDARVSWIARNSSKPDRSRREAWVTHADPEWSAAHLDDDAETVAEAMTETFFEITGAHPREPRLRQVQRWRYSQPLSPTEGDCLWDAELGVGAAGDWCRENGRVEGALLSGMALAGRVLALTSPPTPARP